MDKNTHYFIVGNYMADTYDCYISGWDRIFDPANNLGGMSIIGQIEHYIYNVIKPSGTYETNAPVKTAKAVAAQLGRKKSDASIIIVDEDTKDRIVKHFGAELDQGFGILRVADFA